MASGGAVLVSTCRLALCSEISHSTSWIPEVATEFYRQTLGQVSVVPGETKTFTFDLPPVPPEALATLKACLETVDRIQGPGSEGLHRLDAHDLPRGPGGRILSPPLVWRSGAPARCGRCH